MIGILLIAGKGTRMRSSKPKVLFEINGAPMAMQPLRVLLKCCDKVIAVIGHQAEQVQERVLGSLAVDSEHAKDSGKITFVRQEVPKGTGDAVRTAVRAFATDLPKNGVVIFNGDLPLVEVETVEGFLKTAQDRKLDSACLSFLQKTPNSFGKIVRDDVGVFRAIREESEANAQEKKISEANAGVYYFSGKFLASKIEDLKSDNNKDEFYLTDLLGNAEGQSSESIVWKKTEDLMGVNTTYELSLAKDLAQKRLQKTICEKHGVEIESPHSVFIESGVKFLGSCYIGPGVSLRGQTTIGENVHFEGSAQVVSSSIGAETRIRWGCSIDSSHVGESCSIGPMAHLRPETELQSDCRIGNFVETKKAKLAKGVKAAHLSYLGDVEVGEGANIGCGTITCNYDGKNKNLTKIGAGAFIGSDSQLIAPLEIGEGAYVASGTTVTKNVPADALALARPNFVIKEGYAKRLLKK